MDEAAYRKQLRRLIQAGVHGIFAGGSAGEGPLLVHNEWARMVAIAYDECHGKTHLLGGAMETSTRRILERVKILAQIGYDKFVVSPTYYVGSKLAEEHLRLFGACKEHSEGMELIVYNIPSCTGSTIRVDTVCEMARRGWIRYCKESSEDMDYFGELVTKGGPLGLRVLMGSGAGQPKGSSWELGGSFRFAPTMNRALMSQPTKAAMTGRNWRTTQERINALVQNLALGPRMWLAGVKYAVSKIQGGSARPVSPLEPLNEAERSRIDSFLECGGRSVRCGSAALTCGKACLSVSSDYHTLAEAMPRLMVPRAGRGRTLTDGS